MVACKDKRNFANFQCVNELEEGLASAQRNYAQPLRSKFERVAVKHYFGVEDARRLV